MSDSDKDTSAAIDKVVGAFRAQREQGKAAASAADEPQADTPAADAQAQPGPTPITKLDDPAPTPQGGGGSDAPTKAFKIPAEVAAAAKGDAAAKAADSGAEDSADADDADAGGDDAADDAATDGTTTDDTATGLREEIVVGDPLAAGIAPDPAPADPTDAKADLVEQSIELSADADGSDDDQPSEDETPTEAISADEVAAAAAQAGKDDAAEQDAPAADEAPTTKMKVPAAAAAAAATAATATAATAKPKTDTAPAPAPAPKSEPQVVAPAQPERTKRKTGKLVAILLAVLVVIAVIAVGLWYLLVGSSDQSKVADAAQSYQNAMNDGDLDELRSLTCGEKYAYYSEVSAEDFQKAFAAQKARNELMTFDDVKAVQIDGDIARVGVDMYPSSDPSQTAPAQITLHNIDGEWKVCTEP
ncbi:Rv0361 family membrane protein [Gordonia hydrophobica]|uniref:Nuclear transport factor 2 family protein n=1 Tax=Gordonia hydrophobica TaxID=40516 RepID=A0ABZ2U6M2_9ACTN|nr:nuclear transport factor 2 family protein [Gordonia hydrophobica]MBM7366156.1 chemotaxis protein histidine kinase CheA [Gordonia hydrophobica]